MVVAHGYEEVLGRQALRVEELDRRRHEHGGLGDRRRVVRRPRHRQVRAHVAVVRVYTRALSNAELTNNYEAERVRFALPFPSIM